MDNPTFIALESLRMAWSEKTFPEATATSAIAKCKEELKEIEVNLQKGIKDPEEYADALMCLFDSAGRDGISARKILYAFERKFYKNISRRWQHNGDGTYSHLK
jgi:hypothetical protein